MNQCYQFYEYLILGNTSSNPVLCTAVVGLVSYAPHPGSMIWIWGGLIKQLIVDLGWIHINCLLPQINKMQTCGGLTKSLIVNLGADLC